MERVIFNVGRTIAGLVSAALFAEITVIGMHALLDDTDILWKEANMKLKQEPEPVKRGLFHRTKKGGR